ncbi:phosphatidylinositol phosphodiesterase like protein [Babesia gibsoni]|uniref:Phosphatidylinositol phosphodiesterase like protein n=1 Tax=Babesia gibsoni TaxID=33632 RepID=A0AAD8LM59_BABGI|nr:phosphatidylinositol phosphodiesterase like protein [Babesia gibsoni]
MTVPLVFGHRGMGCSIPGTLSIYPENSLTAFKAAKEIGVDGVELDVFLSKNGEILVIHGFRDVNSLCLTTLPRASGDGKRTFVMEDLVETMDVRASDLLLRKPWASLHGNEDTHKIMQKFRESKEASYVEYITNMDDADGESVPTLEEVVELLGDSVQYNIELKGMRQELGLRVLECLEKHKNIKALISSFNWEPPELDENSPYANVELERFPNGKVKADLLRPLVGNKLGVPLGLLFNANDSQLPSINRIVQCAKSFNAAFVNVAHDFWSVPNQFLEQSQEEGTDVLEYFVIEMHRHDLKVLSYFFASGPDNEEDLKRHVNSPVDIICPNDVERTVKLVKDALNDRLP